jgi:hypothetical protein
LEFEGKLCHFCGCRKRIETDQNHPCGDCEQDVAQIGSPSTPQPWLMMFDLAFLEAILGLYRRFYWIGRDLEW